MVASCSRVTWLSGEKVVGLVPWMTPFSWAQATAWVYQVSAGTSEKVTSPETAGSPAMR